MAVRRLYLYPADLAHEAIMRTWILLADAASARLLQSNEGLSDWTLVRDLSHAESRAHGLASDKPGRVRQTTTGARVALAPPTPIKKKEAEKFARQVATVLEEGAEHSAFDQLILVAPPAFLGILREVLPRAVSAKVSQEIEKDYLHLEQPKLKERLQEALHPR